MSASSLAPAPYRGVPIGEARLIDCYPFGSVAYFDHGFRYVAVGGHGWRALDVDPSALVGRAFEDLWDEPTAMVLRKLGARALAGGEAQERVAYGGFIYDVWAGPAPTPGQGMFISRDVTEEASAIAWSDLLAQAVDATTVGITIAVEDGDDRPIVYANDGFCRLTGYDRHEVIGRDCRFLQTKNVDAKSRRRLRAALSSGEGLQVELTNLRKDGTPFLNRLTINPLVSTDGKTYYVGIQEDITELRERIEEREHAMRLIEVGTLTSGIAHDFNNLLMEILGRTSLALMDRPGDEELEAIEAAAMRGAALVDRLMRRARRPAESEAAASPSAIEDRLQDLERLMPASVRLEVDPPPAPVRIDMSDLQLERILLNLAANAADAMPDGGTFTLKWRETPPSWVLLEARDDGEGMPSHVRERAFEQFFTTKGTRGTGLGLATVHQLVREAGGTIHVDSEVGVGTCFSLRLPRAQGAQDAPQRVLIVDDDAGVRSMLKRVLGRWGWRVTCVACGEEALEQFRRGPAPFDALVCDVHLPDVDGEHVAALALAQPSSGRPRVVFTSGDPGARHQLPADAVFLTKPFDLEVLAGALAPRARDRASA